jgi:hypothetical protein
MAESMTGHYYYGFHAWCSVFLSCLKFYIVAFLLGKKSNHLSREIAEL